LNTATPSRCPEQLSQELAAALLDNAQLKEHILWQEKRYALMEEELRLVLIKKVVMYVEVTKREKRACSRCEELEVSTAPVPAAIIEKGTLADNLVVETIISKYIDHVPLYRQAVRLGRDVGVEISQSTLSSSVLQAGELLLGVVAEMKVQLLAGGYIQADETTVPVQSERTRGRNHQAYLCEYSTPGGVVLYDFQMGRARSGPAGFLKGFGGWLQSDGYAAYGNLGSAGLLHFGCFAHARRKFFDVSKLDSKDARCVAVVRANGDALPGGALGEGSKPVRTGAGSAAGEEVSGAA
jgi:transposase